MLERIVIMNGTTDIAETCIGFSYINGSNILSNPITYNRIASTGSLLFRNDDNRWTDDVLDDIDELTITLDNLTVNCKMQSYERLIHQAQVRMIISSRLDYDNRVTVDLSSNSNESSLLNASRYQNAALSIANQSAWVGYVASSGLCYNESLSQFIKDFSVYADAHVAERADGSLIAFLAATENRSPSLAISDTTHNISAPRVISRWRPGWKRDTQVWHRLDSTLIYQDIEYFRDARVRSIGDLTDTGVNIDFHGVAVGLNSSLQRSDWAFFEADSQLNLYINAADGGGQERYPFTTGGWNNLGSGWVFVRISPNNFDQEWYDVQNARLRYGEEIRCNYYSGGTESVARIESVSDDDELNPLPTTGIYMEDSVRSRITTKLRRLQERDTRVTRLVFPLTGQESLLDLEIGDLVTVDIDTPELNISAEHYICFIRRDIFAGRMPTLTVDVLSHRDVARTTANYLTWRGDRLTWRGGALTWR